MSRRKIIIVIVAAVVVIGAVALSKYDTTPSTTESGEPKSILGSLFPFGTNPKPAATTGGEGGTTTGGTTTGGGTGTTTPTTHRLTQLSTKLIAGFTFLPVDTTKPTESFDISGNTTTAKPVGPTVRFIERGTGYVYDVGADGAQGKKVSGTVVARTAQAFFGADGTSVILRYIKTDGTTVATYLGHITPSTDSLTDGTLKGDFLPDNLGDLTLSPDKKSFLFLLPTGSGIAGISMKTDGTGKKQLFSSSFSEWLVDWAATGPVLTTKASGTTDGFVYSVGATGILQKIVGNVTGLTSKVSPDGKNLLYSISGGNGLDLHVRHIKDGTDVNTGLQTLPEKCTWSADSITAYCAAPQTAPTALYPDAWYQGTIHFIDALWKVAPDTGLTTEVNNGEGNAIDATNLALDPAGGYLVFTNKTDGSLWSLSFAPIPAPTAPSLPTVH